MSTQSWDKPKLDSLDTRRIVSAFIDFLNSVEPAPDVDMEGLDVTKDCLINVFNLDASSIGNKRNPPLLEMFESAERTLKRTVLPEIIKVTLTSTSMEEGDEDNDDGDDNDDDDDSYSEPPKLMDDGEWTSKLYSLGISKDELIDQYFAALVNMKDFSTTIDGNDDLIKVPKVTRAFQDAFMEMERSGGYTCSLNTFADTLKTQGNNAMQSKLYNDAIKLYTCAVSLCENNAIFYCNRACALTNIGENSEAIRDCEKAIEFDARYTKAYNRLGSAYLAQGSYRDAIDKGFQKALELEPNDRVAKEYIRVARQKLRTSSSQMSSRRSRARVEPRSQPEISIDTSGIAPEDISTYIMNLFQAAGIGIRGDALDPRGPRRD